jgi:hypothetical protein
VVAMTKAKRRIAAAGDDMLDRVGPALEDARDMLVPAAQQALKDGKRHGRKAAVKLRLAEEPKSGHKLRNLLILLGLGGVGFIAYKKFFGGDDPWADAETGTSER